MRSTRCSRARRPAEIWPGFTYSEEPLVSSDIVKSPYSAIFDAPLTCVVDGNQVKVWRGTTMSGDIPTG